jgi:hypothetical protein
MLWQVSTETKYPTEKFKMQIISIPVRVDGVTVDNTAGVLNVKPVFVKNDGSVNPGNLLYNAGMEKWNNGAALAPDYWTLGGAGASVAKENTIIYEGTYASKLTRAGTDCYLLQDIVATKGLAYWKGKYLSVGFWVYATVANRARILCYDGTATYPSTFHPGDSAWHFLTVTFQIAAGASILWVTGEIVSGNTTAYFDDAICVEGNYTLLPGTDSMTLNYTAKTSYTIAMTVAQFLNLLPHPICTTVTVSYV